MPPAGPSARCSTTSRAAIPPSARTCFDDGGDLNRFVNVYVNNEDVRLGGGLDTAVGPDSTVIVLPAMAGGAA